MTAMIFSAVVLCVGVSVRGFFVQGQPQHRYLSLYYFVYFGLLYLTVMIGFALIYVILNINGYTVWTEVTLNQLPFWERFFTSLYFSGITLFSVGYGDIVPEGVGRWVALVEAWTGYTIPTAFVVRTMLEKET
ncbi:ion channel [Bacillus sp. FJAT-52991]|uniref:Ion channel n=1 Tax=Bacillus kandeliae TaxID=3129297 RepID=A0ABZ2N893_9BACI